ncbi:MAG: DoxX family protein [Proteobacteria bacterium]|nr:DoxX family protein [Pseudomonadota bacterium]
MRVASAGHGVFAVTLVAIGIVGLIQGGFVAGWEGVPKGMPARAALAYGCAVVSLVCGMGLLWRRTAAVAARVLLACLLLWMVFVKGRYIVAAPLVEGSYQFWGETAVVVAAAWVLYAWLATDRDRQYLGFAVGDNGVRIARVIYALAMLAFGLSHFFYVGQTAPLVPDWLPWHVGWAYFFGGTYIAAGVGMLLGAYARWAAVLSTLQMALFTLLVWLPSVAAGGATGSQWDEFGVSWLVTVAAWVVADSYRGVPWLAVGRG